jgi:hypothetical protein
MIHIAPRVPVPAYKVFVHETLEVGPRSGHLDVVIDVVVPLVDVVEEAALGSAEDDAAVALTRYETAPLSGNHVIDLPWTMAKAVRVLDGSWYAARQVRGSRSYGAGGSANGDDERLELGEKG